MRYIGEAKSGGWNVGAKLMFLPFLLDLPREFESFDSFKKKGSFVFVDYSSRSSILARNV